jgi:hypothetical protein
MRFSLFWDFASVIWEFVTDVLEQLIAPIFIISPSKMGPIGCPETSVTNYQSTLSKVPEELKSPN